MTKPCPSCERPIGLSAREFFGIDKDITDEKVTVSMRVDVERFCADCDILIEELVAQGETDLELKPCERQ